MTIHNETLKLKIQFISELLHTTYRSKQDYSPYGIDSIVELAMEGINLIYRFCIHPHLSALMVISSRLCLSV